jgi:hypothetical protein
MNIQALKIEARLPNVQNPADTHINACAVLSQLGRHQTALEHAQQALILLQVGITHLVCEASLYFCSFKVDLHRDDILGGVAGSSRKFRCRGASAS